ncbi:MULTISPECIES: hypothetical protein [Kocuria]|uniref:hypothetical protein n=1 Tax=Kocuria TaxID=57493 RepID=UPI0022E8A661|nr:MULTISPECIES: hypothetical protein [Kocuria]
MPSQDKREQMMRRRPQRSEAGESPDFKAAFRDTSESKKKLTVLLPEARFEKLRSIAFQRRTTMTAIVSELIDTLDE